MNFASDNTAGVSQPILDALGLANDGRASSYGADEWTKRATEALCEVFEREVGVFLVPTGTAANALAIAAATPPWGAVFCHADSHINTDECGAPEFYSGGAKLVTLTGGGAKVDADECEAMLKGWGFGVVHQVQPACLSISQASEFGLVYKPDEIARLSEICRRHGMALHMDGARFANAVVSMNASPADITWKAGVDILSFGATKNGAMCAEAVVVFRDDLRASLGYRRKRAAQLFSKGRFLGAQMAAYLENGHWLELAGRANVAAARLEAVFRKATGARVAGPVEANEVFVWLNEAADRALKGAGAVYYDWSGDPGLGVPGGAGEKLCRFVTAFATTEDHIDGVARALGA
ncbi:threonine aldolase family protein [Lutibaculum baratangense]|uniref:L-threonine aldolase n=1 Tax=Lutibaculum baratangense AMV1 TaxID=631454 RepID=V4TD85_9HYPH|nr:low specificity L-threonine aldolase [Lutibaculum baratangense]ESR24253.1 Low-specificity L-threonine aldolase [Lutibaculum baratangense AMV1]